MARVREQHVEYTRSFCLSDWECRCKPLSLRLTEIGIKGYLKMENKFSVLAVDGQQQ